MMDAFDVAGWYARLPVMVLPTNNEKCFNAVETNLSASVDKMSAVSTDRA
jgi:hypothetical protein